MPGHSSVTSYCRFVEPVRYQLPDLGEDEVKHGVKIQIFNFYNQTFGNATLPAKSRQRPKRPILSRANPVKSAF